MNEWDSIIFNSLVLSVIGLALHMIFKLFVYWRAKWMKTMEKTIGNIPPKSR